MKIEFVPRDKQHSEYDWADISNEDGRIGKARCKIENVTIIICSINIYPEWAGHGYGREFVDYCKGHFKVVIADRVRPTAAGFWETLGFHDNQDGTWIYRCVFENKTNDISEGESSCQKITQKRIPKKSSFH